MDVTEARDRIRLAYDPDVLQAAAQRLAHVLGGHFRSVLREETPVLNWQAPEEAIEAARETARGGGQTASATDTVDHFERLARMILTRGHNLHHPRYVGHQVPAPVPLAGLFDAIGAVTNQVMAVYEMGPWATATEQAMIRELAQYLSWPTGTFAGFVTHGASLANLNALLVARNVTLRSSWRDGLAQSAPAPVVLVQADAHYSLSRAAGILGLGVDHVIKVPLDPQRRMDPTALEQLIRSSRDAGHPIIAVVACACSTPIGAFDPLNAIADVCERHDVWLHVDAAHGGSALLSPRHRHLVDGLQRADSLVWDAHKMLFVPALCAMLFFRDRRHSYEAFTQDAPYLFDPAAAGLAEYDLGLRTVECTKRAATFGLWGVWSLFGPQLFIDLVDVTFQLGAQFYDLLREAPDFEPLHIPQCNIVTFRYCPPSLREADPQMQARFLRQLRRTVIESGEFYLVATQLNGAEALRVTFINPLTTRAHQEQLLQTLRRHAQVLLESA